jgi:flavin-dependent dehydrogenase
MHYNIELGSLADDAISEFSKAHATNDTAHYEAFLDRSAEYCKAVRTAYMPPVETDILDSMPDTIADFMRAVIRNEQPLPSATAKLEAIQSLEELLQRIRDQRRQPSQEECLKIAKTIYITSGAEPR